MVSKATLKSRVVVMTGLAMALALVIFAAAVDEHDHVIGENDAYAQSKFIIQKIEKILKKAGAGLEHVIRTRMFVTDISRWEEYGKAHGEFFGQIKPCTTMVEVKALIQPEFLIEIEATAIVGEHLYSYSTLKSQYSIQ